MNGEVWISKPNESLCHEKTAQSANNTDKYQNSNCYPYG